MKFGSILVLTSTLFLALCKGSSRCTTSKCSPKESWDSFSEDTESSRSKKSSSVVSKASLFQRNRNLVFETTSKKSKCDSSSEDSCTDDSDTCDTSYTSDSSSDSPCPSPSPTPSFPCDTKPCGTTFDSCNLLSICRPADTLCPEIYKYCEIFNKQSLTYVANFTNQLSDIIKNNLGPALTNTAKYLPPTCGETELEALITKFGTDNCAVSVAGQNKLKDLRVKAIQGITKEVYALMKCEEKNIVDKSSCEGLTNLRFYVASLPLNTAVLNIQAHSGSIISKYLNEMTEAQKAIVTAEATKSKCAELPEYLTSLDDIRTKTATCLTTALKVMTTDAETQSKAITDAIDALTKQKEAEFEDQVKNFVNTIGTLIFGKAKSE